MTLDILLLLLLVAVIIKTSYTDLKYTLIYNKTLIVALTIALLLHVLQGTWLESLKVMVISFIIFLIVYLFKMTSAGDVKLFAVLGAIVADMEIMFGAFFIYAISQVFVGGYALIKTAKGNPKTLVKLLKQDVVGFMTKTGSAIQPIKFPAALIIGISVVGSVILHY